MRSRPSHVRQQLGIGATGFLGGISQDRQSVPRLFGVDGMSQADDGMRLRKCHRRREQAFQPADDRGVAEFQVAGDT
jgi:hypothetical protein